MIVFMAQMDNQLLLAILYPNIFPQISHNLLKKITP